jgi:hypothetical protein
VKEAATQWEVTGTSPQVHNEPGLTPDVIQAVEKKATFSGKVEVPAYAAELWRLEVK